MLRHEILSGKVQLYRRENSSFWWCSASVDGEQFRSSTKEDSLAHAKEIAEDWYFGLRGKARAGLLDKKEDKETKPDEETFDEAAEIFEREYEILTEGQRSPRWVAGHKERLRNHLRPFFGKMGVSEIDGGTAQKYRITRALQGSLKRKKSGSGDGEGADNKNKNEEKPKPPARNTIHNEIVTLRMVLKGSVRRRTLARLPDLSHPFKMETKISHRPWFSLEEYKKLYTATREYAKSPLRERYRWDAEQLHDYVLFMANTGLRVDEAKNLEHRDVVMAKDESTGKLILEIEVRGKRGNGYCKSTPEAVKPYQRLLTRPKWVPQGRKPRSKKALAAWSPPKALNTPQPTDPVFPGNHIKLFNKILHKTGLKFNRDGKARTAGCLRHTYTCLRLTEGAEIYQLAKNLRTSVEMIQKFYAAHLKHTLDAASINTRKHRRRPDKPLENVTTTPAP